MMMIIETGTNLYIPTKWFNQIRIKVRKIEINLRIIAFGAFSLD